LLPAPPWNTGGLAHATQTLQALQTEAAQRGFNLIAQKAHNTL